jgi:hypothetical protein
MLSIVLTIVALLNVCFGQTLPKLYDDFSVTIEADLEERNATTRFREWHSFTEGFFRFEVHYNDTQVKLNVYSFLFVCKRCLLSFFFRILRVQWVYGRVDVLMSKFNNNSFISYRFVCFALFFLNSISLSL